MGQQCLCSSLQVVGYEIRAGAVGRDAAACKRPDPMDIISAIDKVFIVSSNTNRISAL